MRAFLAVLIVLLAGRSAHPAEFLNARHAYVRGETVAFRVWSPGPEIALSVGGWMPKTVAVQDGEARYEVDTWLLRAGDYDVRAQPLRNAQPSGEAAVFPITLASERDPDRFPVWCWGSAMASDLSWWMARGFNGYTLGSTRDPTGGGPAGETGRLLGEATGRGLDVGAYFYPLLSARWQRDEAVRCRLLDGTLHRSAVYPREPAVLEHAQRTAAAWLERYAGYPSFRGALLNSEYVVPFCTNEPARTALKEETGLNLDDVLRSPWMRTDHALLDASKLPPELQPREGLIADAHAVYRFLTWWWERGHGTSVLDAAMARLIKEAKPGALVWHDPYRDAPVSSAHPGLDTVSTWTYGHPDIKRLAYTTVLQAAARPDAQKVMQTITLYLYARFVTPVDRSSAQVLNDQAGRDAHFNAGPDYAREAMWLVLSQRPDILGFYFPGDSRPANAAADPYVSSPETFDAIGEVCRSLVEPYGPLILHSHRLRPRVAVLNSATAIWFPGAPLWYSYAAEQILPYCALLMMNHVPFDVLLDDDVGAGRLDEYDVLVIPRGDTLTKGVHERIVAFARKQKVIANKTMRADVPGALRTDFDFAFERQVDGTLLSKGQALTALEHRARMEAYADQLRPLLAAERGPVDCESQRVLVNVLESGDLRYAFLINDERVAGPRFGRWKLTLDIGVRQTATMRVAAPDGSVLYDAIARRRIEAKAAGGSLAFSVTLPPARGKLVAVLPDRIDRVEVTTAAQCVRGAPNPISARVLGASGEPFRGALPVRIEIVDPLGRKHPSSRSVALEGADWSFAFRPALNDPAGEWTVRVAELLGGARAERTFRLP